MECAKWQWLATAMQCVEWSVSNSDGNGVRQVATGGDSNEVLQMATAMVALDHSGCQQGWSALNGNVVWRRKWSASSGNG